MDQYRHHLLGFLQNPERSGIYAIGGEEYTKAILCCIQHLERRRSNTKRAMNEDMLSDQISLDNGIWKFDCSKLPRLYCTETVSIFIYLGYVLFFLPLSGKSQQLIQYCHQPTFLTETATSLFPTRIALVRQAMKDYLDRVEGQPLLE